MSANPSYTPSELFHLWRAGNQDALNDFLPLVYEELRRVARRHLQGERVGHTLQTTALIHEAYLRLVDQGPKNVQNRAHFVAVTSMLMRQILVDHARERLAQKRNGGRRVELSDDLVASPLEPGVGALDVLAIDSALRRLASIDPQRARIVELRYFGGLSIQETADVLGISEASVKRSWAAARAWLYREIQQLNTD